MNSTSATTIHNLHDPLIIVASIMLICNGIFGCVCNFFILLIFATSSAERTSFNLICVFRAVGNSIILGWAFLATFVPITLFGDSTFSPFYQTLVIGIANSIYSGLQTTAVLIGANRFCAVYFPLVYPKLFNLLATLIMLIATFGFKGYTIVIELLRFLPLECFMIYTVRELTWEPNMDAKCDEDSSANSELNKSTIMLFLLIAFNIATFTKICLFYKATQMEKERINGKVKKNFISFLQTLIQDAIYLIDLIFTFKLSTLSTERYWTFISGTLIWQSVHSLDGFIMIMFNERLSFVKKLLFTSSASHSIQNTKVFVSTTTSRIRQERVHFKPIDC